MRLSTCTAALVVMFLPQLALAQANPVATAFRDNATSEAKNLIAAAEEFDADKYGFKPTPAQMSFGDVVVHLSGGNDYLCGAIGGVKAPERTKVTSSDPKETLVARLKETFAFCHEALEGLDDSKLAESVSFFGRNMTRASMMTLTTADFADHYSQAAIYLRLNGKLPPTAKKPAM